MNTVHHNPLSHRPPASTASTLHETLIVLVFLGIFNLIHLLTGARWPFPWYDEVAYVDPAVNVALGNGLTSTAWYGQTATELWADNVPLYQLLLSLWLKMVGIGVLQARSMAYVMVSMAAWVLWRVVQQHELIRRPVWRILWLTTLLCGYPILWTARSGRPDALCLLLLALVLSAYALKLRVRRLLIAFTLGLFSTWSGLQLVALEMLLAALALLFIGRKVLPYTVVLGLGTIAGFGLLLAFYHHNGVLDAFMSSVTGNSLASDTLEGQQHVNAGGLVFDPAAKLLLIVLGGVCSIGLISGLMRWRSTAIFCVVAAALIPFFMAAASKYLIHYNWMGYLFAVTGVVAAAAQLRATLLARSLSILATVSALIALVIGLPMRALTTGVQWSLRNPYTLRAFVAPFVNSKSVVACDYSLYYVVKPQAYRTLLPSFIAEGIVDTDTRASVDLLVLRPEQIEPVLKSIGGDWNRIDVLKIEHGKGSAIYQYLATLMEAKPELHLFLRADSACSAALLEADDSSNGTGLNARR